MATKAEILDAISGMTVLELSELIKEMEEKFGVSAAAAAVAVAAPAAGGAGAAAAGAGAMGSKGRGNLPYIAPPNELTPLGGSNSKDPFSFVTEHTGIGDAK